MSSPFPAMMRRGTLPLLAALLLPAWVAAQDLLPVPEVTLDSVEAAVRTQLEEGRAKLNERLRGGAQGGGNLAEAFGALGELYVIYDLSEPAEACLRNAITLDRANPRWHYILASVYQLNRRLDEAETELAAAIANGASGAAHIRLGEVRLQQGDLDGARAAFTQAWALPDFGAAALRGLGRVALEQERPLEAIDLLGQALAAQPQATELHFHLGRAYRAAGETNRAREELAKRGNIEVRYPDPIVMELQQSATGVGALLSLGRLSLAENLPDVAEERFREAISIAPDSAAAHRSLAGVLAQRGEIEAAIPLYEKAIDLEPGRAGVRYILAQLLLDHRDPEGQRAERAIFHIERALEQAPDFVPGLLDLASALRSTGRYAEALQKIDRALTLSPGSAGIRFQRAQTLGAAGDVTAALAELARVEASDDPLLRSARVRSDVARLYRTLGDDGRAAAIYSEIASDPQLSRDERAIAWSLFGQVVGEGDPQRGVEAFRKAIELNPSVREAKFNLGKLLGRTGDFAGSATALREALAEDTSRADIRFAAAMALVLSEDFAGARTMLEEGLELDPSQAPLAHLLARVLSSAPDPTVRDAAGSLLLARKLYEAMPRLDHAETVAMAIAEGGNPEQAAIWQQKVVDQIRSAGDEAPAGMLERAERWLATYQRGEAVRSPWLDP